MAKKFVPWEERMARAEIARELKEVITDLARAKAVFQQRAICAAMQIPNPSKGSGNE